MLINCQIFIIGFSSYLILDYKFGNHKIAGLIISFVGMIVILYFFPLVYFIEQRLQNLIITLVIVITGGLTEVLEKYLTLPNLHFVGHVEGKEKEKYCQKLCFLHKLSQRI